MEQHCDNKTYARQKPCAVEGKHTIKRRHGQAGLVMFDVIKINFSKVNDTDFFHTRSIPFVENYLEILKAVAKDVETSHFWLVANFMDVDQFDFGYLPEQHEKDQIHCWHSGDNKEGNVLLIPKEKFLQQMDGLKFLRDFKDINYHRSDKIANPVIGTKYFDLSDPVESYNAHFQDHYVWMINKDLLGIDHPDFFPSFWDGVKMYKFGDTGDVLLCPGGREIKQFYDFKYIVNMPLEYTVNNMDVIFISYDEPSAAKRFEQLKQKAPRAKWVKNVQGQTEAYHAAAELSETGYFFAVFPKLEITENFDFTFQPDRLKNSCHYIFDCKNPVNGLEYGHGAVLLYNKKHTLLTKTPGLDFTLSAPHTHVPLLSAINHFNETPWLTWRTAFREVLKLKQSVDTKPTVESVYRLRKWCEQGTGKNAEWSINGANDASQFYESYKDDKDKLQLSYDWAWLKKHYEEKYELQD